MRPRTASRLAWSLCALTLALICGVVWLTLLNAGDPGSLGFSIVGLTSVFVGRLVASRRPDNPIGWLFLGGALFSTLQTLTAEYAIYGITTDPGALLLGRTVAGFSNALELAGPVLLFILVPLYFPTGRPVSRRWGLVAWLAVGMLPVMTLIKAVSPEEAVSDSGISNPWSVEALRPVVEALDPIGFAFYFGLIFAAAASLLVRLWRSRGEERQQLKWFTFAASFVPIWFLTNAPVERAIPTLFSVMDALVIASVPVATGIAILRYRLYDIDRIINRALVYAALTISLALVYLGSVVALQRLLSPVVGEGNGLAVVASTLAIAALFNPLRRRVQAFVDRRFYRYKYDAERVLAGFSARLRDETDLDRLNEDLLGTVRKTVRPAHASLWLRKESGTVRGTEGWNP
jgi:hypothetical protein